MKLLIATPCYGGLVTTDFVQGLINATYFFNANSIDYKVLTLEGSLISQNRNECAKIAMDLKVDKMLFIDSDTGFNANHIKSLLDSPHLVVGGTYPLKVLPITLNFNTLPKHRHYFDYKKPIDKFKIFKQECADERGEVEVLHLPTGFMMIDMSVFETLKTKVAKYTKFDINKNAILPYYDFFPITIQGDDYESEDWAFCRICRENGIPVYLNTNVILQHQGTFVYKPNL